MDKEEELKEANEVVKKIVMRWILLLVRLLFFLLILC